MVRKESSQPIDPDRTTANVTCRRDLQMARVNQTRGIWWVIKDPIAMRYFHLRDDERFLLQQFDGQTTIPKIIARYQEAYPPHRVTTQAIHRLLYRFVDWCLVISNAPEQSTSLLTRHHRSLARTFWRTLSNPLFVKFPGIDPQKFLDATYPFIRSLFSPAFVVLSIFFICSAAICTLLRWSEFIDRLPSMATMWNGNSLIALAFAITITKIVHELGHAYVCRHFGGECHSIGPLLLIFSPALYCDTSDAWLLPRWQRACVAAAGIYVELVLASCAAFCWWFLHDPTLQFICLRIMFVASASTLLVNGNPLLRYDGYFLLSDLWGIPNLAEQSTNVVRDAFSRVFRQTSRPIAPWLSSGDYVGMFIYAVLAYLYRVALVISIVWYLPEVWDQFQLRSVANLLGIILIAGMTIGPVASLAQELSKPFQPVHRTSKRIWGMWLGIAALMVLAAFIPLPQRVAAPVKIRPQEAKGIYATSAGTLRQVFLDEGRQVAAGTTLLELHDEYLQREVQRLEGQHQEQQQQVTALRKSVLRDPGLESQIPVAEAVEAELAKQLQARRDRLTALHIKSPCSGILHPAAAQYESDHGDRKRDESKLLTWDGRLSDARNLGCYIERGTLICWVAQDSAWEAEAWVPSAEVTHLRPGQRVNVSLDAYPTQRIAAEVTAIAVRPDTSTELPTEPLQSDRYLIRLRLTEPTLSLYHGMTGRCAIHLDDATFLSQTWRKVASLLRMW